MSLTGRPLIVLAVLGTVAVLAATVVTWRWGRRRRYVLRPAGVLLTEAMLLLTVGLIVNRAEQFYPTWATLRQDARTSGTTFAVAPGELDRELRERAGADPGRSIAVTWQPAGWSDWHLARAPMVVTPAGYLQHPGWRYPALLVLDDGTTGWTPAGETVAARAATAAGPAVVVFARTTATTTASTLATALPTALGHDLRVTGGRWALVAPASAAGLAGPTATAVPGRFPAVVLTTVPAPRSAPKANVAVIHRPAAPGTPLPVGITVAVVKVSGAHPAEPAGYTPSAGSTVALSSTAADELGTALDWADRQTPPPLNLSAPPARYLPPRHPKNKHSAQPSPSAAAIRPGGNHAAGQPRH
ncbi:hypothetical protein GCM10010172_62630 [Paractinoplanes ferrugineus]|uniref:Uncharacterized protein n=1 Tax=Paractinoplanes ferrugineus TaxID=113564 RepID=A0A919ME04_9ACTN|nr:hypothetical protein [Actinoplanes ferrugineus]GIE16351.1 hypothetical protein Afe05nite_81910 [Actinoplanes ferrugineus]